MENAFKEKTKQFHMLSIANVAKKLFAEKGFDKTTTDEIAKESKYSKRTIYTYFDSKNDILFYIQLVALSNLKKELKKNGINTIKDLCETVENFKKSSPLDIDYIKKVDLEPKQESKFFTQIKGEVMSIVASIAFMIQNKCPEGVGSINAALLIFDGLLTCLKNQISTLEYFRFLNGNIG